MSDIRDTLERYLQQEVLFSDDPIDDRRDLLLALDSLSLLQLVSFLEEEFGIQIPDAAITAQNFRSLEAVEALVRRTVAAPTST
jgi:acyl carrier protein